MLETVQSNLKNKKGRISKKEIEALTRIREELYFIHEILNGICVISDRRHPKKIHRKAENFTVKK